MKDVSVRPSPGRGRGVFAERDFGEGELIERCPTLVFLPPSRDKFGSTILNSYHFNWIPDSGEVALPLGYGCLYNHSWTPNADWVNRIDENFMDFVAQRPIKAGEEIFTNYRYANDGVPAWYQEGRPAETESGPLTQSPEDAGDGGGGS